ncbi:hypothetical protein NHX12_013247 [Muraenolepis orangiensis]|uniref:Uncharacterized protein n=1 Tax=Muraenolepis orangiensis TaxID=630683 RepID=A0A9Q0I687_9TELE|nr:hypothetical protein NHX12_013247 [Muraenolepis orangiensis]
MAAASCQLTADGLSTRNWTETGPVCHYCWPITLSLNSLWRRTGETGGERRRERRGGEERGGERGGQRRVGICLLLLLANNTPYEGGQGRQEERGGERRG